MVILFDGLIYCWTSEKVCKCVCGSQCMFECEGLSICVNVCESECEGRHACMNMCEYECYSVFKCM